MSIRALNEVLQRKAQEELNEVPDRIKEDIDTIKQWIAKQPHLKAKTDDQWILSFLRGCKFSLERTKEKIDCYYTMRTLIPELLNNRDPLQQEIQDILRHGVVLPLPKTENEAGPRIILFRFGKCNPDVHLFVTMCKVYLMVLDILLNEDDNCMVAGELVVVDHVDFTTGFAVQFTPDLLKKLLNYMSGSCPVRIKGIIIFNSYVFFETIFNMMKTILPEKVKNRMFLYSEKKIDSIYTHVPKELLPKDYGGSNSSVEELTGIWKKKVESYRDWFLEEEKFCTNETLRSGKSRTLVDTFGVEGSFRKLGID